MQISAKFENCHCYRFELYEKVFRERDLLEISTAVLV